MMLLYAKFERLLDCRLAFGVFLTILFFGSSCSQGLVNEEYAAFDRKSINGTDAFLTMVEKEIKKPEKFAYLSQLALEEHDAIIYFQRREYFQDEELRHLEYWLNDLDPEVENENVKEVQETKPKKYTILIFLRDMDTSYEFWQILTKQMKDHPEERKFCANQADDRYSDRMDLTTSGKTLFGERYVWYKEGRLEKDPIVDDRAFPRGIGTFPIRTIPEEAQTDLPVNLQYKSLLSTKEGFDLIREFNLPKGKLILVYNAQPFLNHALLRPENRILAMDLIRYTFNANQSLMYVEQSMLFPSLAEGDQETGFIRILTLYPLNLIFSHFLALLILFVWSKSLWDRPRRTLKEAGSREFVQHLKALGLALSRSRNTEEVLQTLKRFGR